MSDVSSVGYREAGECRDCVVIGAGPAGAMAARRAARQGLSTLLVDRSWFPRSKVCGACLNGHAVSFLDSEGLGGVLPHCGAVPVDRFELQSRGRTLSVPLAGGMALSRAALDAALLQSASDAGATVLQRTSAQVLPENGSSEFRVVRLTSTDSTSCRTDTVDVPARVVIAADGLGHPSVRGLPEFHETIARLSRIGAGAVVDDPDRGPRPGTIQMAAGRNGYVGMVRVEDGRLNVAAAVDPRAVRAEGDLGSVVNRILEESGIELFSDDIAWTGTRLLTRSSSCVAARSVFLAGDAAGYVEPFTGEGIAWALAAGAAAADCAAGAVRLGPREAEHLWALEWKRLVQNRQAWCRRLAWLLRHPEVVPLAIRFAAGIPLLTRPILSHLNVHCTRRKVTL